MPEEEEEGEGGETQDFFFSEGLDGDVLEIDNPFLPEVIVTYGDDEEPDGYAVTFNQAFIYNRTSYSQVQDRDERKIANMSTFNYSLEHEIEYFVEVIIDKYNFLIEKATLTGVSGIVDFVTDFPHIIFDQYDYDVGNFTGYFPVLKLIDGTVDVLTQRSNIQLSDRQMNQKGYAAKPDEDREGPTAGRGSAHPLVEQGHTLESQPTRIKTLRAGSGIIILDDLYSTIDIHATTGWSGENCCIPVSEEDPDCDADWWAYVEGTLMPSKFRGLAAGTGVLFVADEDDCITTIHCTGSGEYLWSGENCYDHDSAPPPDTWFAYDEFTLMPAKFKGLSGGTGITFVADDDDCVTTINCTTGWSGQNTGGGAEVYDEYTLMPSVFRSLTGWNGNIETYGGDELIAISAYYKNCGDDTDAAVADWWAYSGIGFDPDAGIVLKGHDAAIFRGLKAGTGIHFEADVDDCVTTINASGWSGEHCGDTADWWAYEEHTAGTENDPAQFRGLNAGTGIHFDADEDGCVTAISRECCTGTDEYELKTFIYHKDDSSSFLGYPPSTTSIIQFVVNDKEALTINDGNIIIGEQGTYCADVLIYGKLESKGWDSNTHGSISTYDKDGVKTNHLDSDPANDSYLNGDGVGSLGIGTDDPTAGKAITVKGILQVQDSSTSADGSIELGDGTDKTISFETAKGSLVYGAGITEFSSNFTDTIKLFAANGVSVAAQNSFIRGASPATGSIILGGSGNSISGNYNVIVGGAKQLISGSTMNFIGAGSGINIEECEFSSSLGGQNNDISGTKFAFVGGGLNNIISGGLCSVIGGGSTNKVTGSLHSTVVGGYGNTIISATSATIGGGETNTNAADKAFIGAGATNTITAGSDGAAIIGGAGNTISNSVGSFIAAGVETDITTSDYAFAAGNYSRVEAGHDGAFVLSDSVTTPVLSTGADTMVLKFKSGVFIDGDSGLYINSANGIHINGNPVMTGVSDIDIDTLQTVTTRGDTTTTNIISEKIVSGVSGLFNQSVGIGIVNPAYKLDVEQDSATHAARIFNAGDDENRDVLLLQGGTEDYLGNTKFITLAAADGMEHAWIQGADAGGGDAGGLAINTTAADATDFVIAGNGNVGIGTDAPNASCKLHVQGRSYATGAVIGGGILGVTPPTDGLIVQGDVAIGYYNAGNNSLSVYDNGSFGGTYYYYDAPTNGLIVQGDVGIGTYAPSGQLHVDGAIQGGFSLREKSADFILGAVENGTLVNGTSNSFDQISINTDLGADFNVAVLHTGNDVAIVGGPSIFINGTDGGTVTLASGYQPASIVRLTTNTYAVFGNLA